VTSLRPQNAELQRNLSSAAVLRRAQRHKARSSSCLSGAWCSPRRRARRLPGPKQGRRPSSTRAPHATTPSSPATAPFEQPRATQRSTHRSADLLLLLLLQVQQLQCMQPHGSTALTTSTARPITHALALVSALICRVFFPLAHTHTSLSLSLSLSLPSEALSLSRQPALALLYPHHRPCGRSQSSRGGADTGSAAIDPSSGWKLPRAWTARRLSTPLTSFFILFSPV